MLSFNFNCCSLDATCDDGSLGRLVNDQNKKANCVMELVEVDNSGTALTCVCLLWKTYMPAANSDTIMCKQVKISSSLKLVAGGKLWYIALKLFL